MYLYTLKPINHQRTKYYLFAATFNIHQIKKNYPSLPPKGATLKIAFLVERQISSIEIKTAVSGNVIVLCGV